MFVDLVGSTALSEALDAEDFGEVVQQYHALCREQTERFGGHVTQLLGDGVLVYFGYPNTREDDAHRAARCALGIMDGLDELRTRIGIAFGVQLDVRVGVHSGRSVVSALGGEGRRENLAMGQVPNLAARLESIAQPGTVVVSANTARLLGDAFECEPLGVRTVKGFSAPVGVYRLVRDKRVPHRLDALADAQTTPFVGRRDELACLERAWRVAPRGGHLVVVRGAAGLGKSRLVRQFRRDVADAAIVFECFCSPYAQGSPLRAVAETLQRALGLSAMDAEAAKVAAIRRWVDAYPELPADTLPLACRLLDVQAPDDAVAVDGGGAVVRARMLEVIARWFARVAEDGPVLLSFEDVHWADATTLDLISALHVREVPVCLVVTTRPHFEAPWDGTRTTRVALARFERDSAERMITKVAGKPLPVAVLADVLGRVDGVPLYIEELTRVIVESGALVDEGDHYALPSGIGRVSIPDTLDATLNAHLDWLGASKPFAQLAAVIGREFRPAVLAAVAGVSVAELQADLDHLVQSGTLLEKERSGEALYVFKHALLQDAAYNSLLKRTRRQFHERCVDALEGEFAALAAAQPELLAHHLEGAGERARALPLWLEAGTRAADSAAATEAVRFLKRALDNLDALPAGEPRDRVELAIQGTLGPVLMATLGWASQEVAATCGRARELAVALGEYEALYGATWGLWTVRFLRGELPAALEVARGLREMAAQSGAPVLAVTSEHAHGFSRYFMGAFDDAISAADTGLALFTPAQERGIIGLFQFSSSVALLAFRTCSLWMQGRFLDARESEARWHELMASLDHPPSLAFGRSFLEYLQHARGDYDGLLTNARTLMAVSQEGGFELWVAVARIFIAWSQGMRGDAAHAEAAATIRDAMVAFKATGSRVILVEVAAMLAELDLAAGNPTGALEAIDTGVSMIAEREERVFGPELYRLRAEVRFAQGDDPTPDYEAAVDMAAGQGAHALALRACVSAATRLGGTWRGRVEEALRNVQRDPLERDVRAALEVLR